MKMKAMTIVAVVVVDVATAVAVDVAVAMGVVTAMVDVAANFTAVAVAAIEMIVEFVAVSVIVISAAATTVSMEAATTMLAVAVAAGRHWQRQQLRRRLPLDQTLERWRQLQPGCICAFVCYTVLQKHFHIQKVKTNYLHFKHSLCQASGIALSNLGFEKKMDLSKQKTNTNRR